MDAQVSAVELVPGWACFSDEAGGGAVAHAGFAAYEEDGLVELVGGFELEDLFDEFGADAAADEGVAGALGDSYGEHDEADDRCCEDHRQQEDDDRVRHGVSVTPGVAVREGVFFGGGWGAGGNVSSVAVALQGVGGCLALAAQLRS